MSPVERFIRDGQFVCDGVPLDAILRKQPTPFYLYSAATIRDKFTRLLGSFPRFQICYSLKANPNPVVVRLLAQAGTGAEVSSPAELGTALANGINPDDIIFVGPAKTSGQIEAVVSASIGALVVDSRAELEQVDNIAARMEEPVRVLLRVNTMERQPEAKEVMVGGPGKFGFDEETIVADLSGLALTHARIEGIQVYSASQVLDSGFLCEHFDYVFKLAVRLKREAGIAMKCIDFGGGFGIPYEREERELDLAPVTRAVTNLQAEHSAELPDCRFLLETGRYLVGEAGVFVTRVVRVKESRGRVFVITDSGMNGFSRPVFMRVCHPVRVLNRISEPAPGRFDVCGPICTPMDCSVQDVELPRPVPGDIIGFFNAGAYGYTMSLLDFMSLERPTELLADRGSVRQIR